MEQILVDNSGIWGRGDSSSGLARVGDHGSDDHRRADLGLERQGHVEVHGVEEHAEQDGHRRREALDDVVRVLQDQRHQEPTDPLRNDRRPNDAVVPGG